MKAAKYQESINMSREQHTHAQSCSTRLAVHMALWFLSECIKAEPKYGWEISRCWTVGGETSAAIGVTTAAAEPAITGGIIGPISARPACVPDGNQLLLDSRRSRSNSSSRTGHSNGRKASWIKSDGTNFALRLCRLASMRWLKERCCS